MVCDTPYLQNEFGDPRFFYVFNLVLSFSTCSQSFKKICAWEILGANVLKLDGIGVGRIRTFPFLPIPFTTPSLMIQWKLGCRSRKQNRKNQPIAQPGIEQCHWFILPLLLATLTMQFSLDRKRRSHKQNQCSASDSVGLIFTRSYRPTLLTASRLAIKNGVGCGKPVLTRPRFNFTAKDSTCPTRISHFPLFTNCTNVYRIIKCCKVKKYASNRFFSPKFTLIH